LNENFSLQGRSKKFPSVVAKFFVCFGSLGI